MLLYPSLDFSNKFHVEHMYPKSKFEKTYLHKMGINEGQIDKYINSVNDISNIEQHSLMKRSKTLILMFGLQSNAIQIMIKFSIETFIFFWIWNINIQIS